VLGSPRPAAAAVEREHGRRRPDAARRRAGDWPTWLRALVHRTDEVTSTCARRRPRREPRPARGLPRVRDRDARRVPASSRSSCTPTCPTWRHHGVWPVGEEWLFQAWGTSWLPVTRLLERARRRGHRDVLTLGVTPMVAHQVADPRLAGPRDLARRADVAQRGAALAPPRAEVRGAVDLLLAPVPATCSTTTRTSSAAVGCCRVARPRRRAG
jgi:hypothetical protein